jgi:hypothetical protein
MTLVVGCVCSASTKNYFVVVSLPLVKSELNVTTVMKTAKQKRPIQERMQSMSFFFFT